jgi:hypothetical protein
MLWRSYISKTGTLLGGVPQRARILSQTNVNGKIEICSYASKICFHHSSVAEHSHLLVCDNVFWQVLVSGSEDCTAFERIFI